MTFRSYDKHPIRRGRKIYLAFNVLGATSSQFLTGHIITLLLLRLRASSTLVGAVSSFVYVSLLVMAFGRQPAHAYGVVRTYVGAVLARNVSATLIPIAIVIVSVGGAVDVAVIMLVVGSFLIFAFRGLSLAADTRLMGALSEGRDRGAFVSHVYAVNHVTLLTLGLAMGPFLGADAPIGRYLPFVLVGVLAGLAGAALLTRLREPEDAEHHAEPTKDGASTAAEPQKHLDETAFRFFVAVVVAAGFLTGATKPFLLVFAKVVHGLSDGESVVLTVVGSLGAVAAGVTAANTMDRVGARPVLILFSAMTIPALLLAVVATPTAQLPGALALGTIFFVAGYCTTGVEVAAVTYLYAGTHPKRHVDRGVTFYFALGAGGGLGSFFGGFVLDAATVLGVSDPMTRFRILFVLLLGLTIMLLLLSARIPRLGAHSVRRVVVSLLSPNDHRAVALVRRLDRSATPADEIQALRELIALRSPESTEAVLTRLESPSFSVRTEALTALEWLAIDDERINAALDHEVREHEYTTAHIAARVLGMRGDGQSVSLLRERLRTAADPHLVAELVLALARLKDVASVDSIRALLSTTSNPLVLIFCAEAVRLLDVVDASGDLVLWLKAHEMPVFVRDQVVLSLAGLCGMERSFFRLYAGFIHDPVESLATLHDRFLALGRSDLDALQTAFQQFGGGAPGSPPADPIIPRLSAVMHAAVQKAPATAVTARLRGIVGPIAAAAGDPRLAGYPRFRFFFLAFCIHCLEPQDDRELAGPTRQGDRRE